LVLNELGEGFLNRIGARCVALFKTGHVVSTPYQADGSSPFDRFEELKRLVPTK
jgi:hypothetical protein